MGDIERFRSGFRSCRGSALGFLWLAILVSACIPERRTYGQPPPDSFREVERRLTIGETESVVPGAEVTRAFFDATRGVPLVGRAFVAEDFSAETTTIVIGHSLWQDRFGSLPEVIGRQVTLDGRPVTIVGVMPRDFDIPVRAQFWTPAPPR
jgi:hypothetical protein